MPDWSYAHQYVKLRGKRDSELVALQERGSEGWELVSAVPLAKRASRSTRADLLLLFKRPQDGTATEDAETAPDQVEEASNQKRRSRANGSTSDADTEAGGAKASEPAAS